MSRNLKAQNWCFLGLAHFCAYWESVDKSQSGVTITGVRPYLSDYHMAGVQEPLVVNANESQS